MNSAFRNKGLSMHIYIYHNFFGAAHLAVINLISQVSDRRSNINSRSDFLNLKEPQSSGGLRLVHS